ncbi:hypothetical protein BU24DRAFT_464029 [Aaosphaeria arxii CBS 175.79]|uniref:PWWP domain-containing protein n=1 Tax=Aaosphaeria arxii CBS 175.79 TaxID=1450172 RepID=A0A6A5XLN2_9PLEO|nr:uncharacterized protein BU24DRAFT_464029 [Aaosphaeria arxii CBS 175.79]KAF2013214.1 hypothetical protein BU24DRAFT_464029 [Aaosphaeria arxii CBS 175.79]
MADATNAPPAVDATKVDDETTRPVDAPTEPVASEAKPEEGGDVAPEAASAEESKEVAQDDAPTEKPTSDANDDDTKAENDTVEDVASTPNTKKTPNGNRRKSTSKASGGNKKTPAKKKATVTPRLDVEPGDVFFVAMKGFQPWPVIVCDEEMLPEALLSKRPVSAKRIDGTYREDFLEGGKNAKDRRYPVMFMGSNEFAWQVNTDLQDLDLDAIKKDVEAGNSQKKTKGLWEAYQIAAEGHDLSWFKDVLEGHEQAMQHDADEKEAAAAAKKEKEAAKKGKRKSLAAEDVEEDIAEGTASAKKAKPSKKRKKDSESDGEPEKATKTPKTTKLKLNAPKDASAAKPKKETKAKKTKAKTGSEEAEAAKPQEPQETEAERYEKQQKTVLYLRHKLQKGFISRENPPSADEMPQMSNYIKQLEDTDGIAASIIKKTKVHKVLKGIVKLDSIPREDEFEFKRRSTELLTRWAKVLSADTEAAEPASVTPAAPATNGVNNHHKSEEASNKPEEAEKEAEASSKADGDGDIAMADAKDEAPAVETTEEPTTEPATKATEEVATS